MHFLSGLKKKMTDAQVSLRSQQAATHQQEYDSTMITARTAEERSEQPSEGARVRPHCSPSGHPGSSACRTTTTSAHARPAATLQDQPQPTISKQAVAYCRMYYQAARSSQQRLPLASSSYKWWRCYCAPPSEGGGGRPASFRSAPSQLRIAMQRVSQS